jgi:hypothetical protein
MQASRAIIQHLRSYCTCGGMVHAAFGFWRRVHLEHLLRRITSNGFHRNATVAGGGQLHSARIAEAGTAFRVHSAQYNVNKPSRLIPLGLRAPMKTHSPFPNERCACAIAHCAARGFVVVATRTTHLRGPSAFRRFLVCFALCTRARASIGTRNLF